MSLGIKTADGVIPIHSVRVKPTTVAKSITANDTYTAADDNVDGYSAVTVAVPELPITFLKSIKSLGNSVILTDIVNDYTDSVFFDIKLENPSYESGGDILYGVQDTAQHYLAAVSKYDQYSGATFVAYSGFVPASGDDYYVMVGDNNLNKRNSITIRRGDGKCILGDASFTMSGTITDAAPTTGAVICGAARNGGIVPYKRFNATIYGIQIFDSLGVLQHNLVPAQSKATGRGGLYDIITGTFYPAHEGFDDFIKEVI